MAKSIISRVRVSLDSPNGLIVFGRGQDVYEATENAEHFWQQDVGTDRIPLAVHIGIERGTKTKNGDRWDFLREVINVELPRSLVNMIVQAVTWTADRATDDSCRQYVRPVVDIGALVDFAIEEAGTDHDQINAVCNLKAKE